MKNLWNMNLGFLGRIASGTAALIFCCLTAFGQSTPPMMVQVPFISVGAGDVVAGVSSTSKAAACTGYANAGGNNYGDGCAANQVGVSTPWGVTVDAWGNVYFSDEGHLEVRVIYAGATTVNGVANPATAMIPAANAPLGIPGTLVAGDVYALAGGLTAVMSGTCNGGGSSINTNGSGCPATDSYIKGPYSPAVDSAGNVFIPDKSNSLIYVVLANATGLAAQLVATENPTTFSTCTTFSSVLSCTGAAPQVGFIYQIVGSSGGWTDNALANGIGKIHAPYSVAVDASENLYIADETNDAVRMVNGPNTSETTAICGSTTCGPGYIRTIAGAGSCSTASCTGIATPLAASTAPTSNAAALGAAFSLPGAVAVDASGNVYIADNSGGTASVYTTVRVIYAGGTNNPLANLIKLETGVTSPTANYVYTLAGDAVGGSSAKGAGLIANASGVAFDRIQGLGLDGHGNIYVMDYGSHSELAEVNANTGILTFLSADGLPTAGVAFSGANVYCSSGTVTGSGPLTLDKYGDGCPAPQSFTSNAVGNIGIDPSGNIYYADNGDGLIRKLSFNNSFPATTVGSPAPTQNLAFVLFTGNTGDTVTSSTMADSVTTQGITAGSEFTNAVIGDSCGGTTTLAVFLSGSTNVANDVCIIPVTFTPMYAGMRSGAVQISGTINSVSTLLGTVYLNGAGNGAELAIDPGTTSTLGSKNQTSGVATDSAGNVYVDYFASKSIYRIPSGGGTPVKIASLSDFPCQIAVDGAGNLYVAVISGNIYEFAGASTSAGLITETPIVSGLSSDTQGVAVDASGNLYIADTYNNRVLMQPVGNGEQMVLGSGFSLPVSVAVDASGNVYVADSSLKEVEKLTIVNGAVVQQAAVTLLSGAHPASVAVDAAGDIYYGDYNTGQIVEVPVSGTTEVVASGFTYPANIALDPSGNLYVADSQSNSGISEFARTAASQTLASGTPQIATVTEIGNVNYTGSTSQTDSVDFSVVGDGICSTTAQFTLDLGATCELTSSLLGGGSVSDTVSFTGSTSTLNLSPAVGTTTTLGTVTSTSSSPTYGDTITVTVTVAANSGSTTPSGTVSFVVDSGLSSAPFTLTSGSYVYTLSTPASPLSAGAHTIAATYNPGTGSLFAGSSGTLSPSLTVLPMAVTVAPSPVTITYGQSSPITISSIAGTSGNIVGLLPLDSSDTAKFSTLATTTSPVSGSPYAITGSLYTSGGGVDSNYTVSVSSSSTVTIQPAALTLVINNASMSTGQSSLPTFTGTLSGYLPADANYVAPVYSTTATVSSPVGQYTITATGLQAGSSGDRSSDYTLPLANITTGTLTISSSVVSEVVTVTSTTTVSYGQAVPAITGTFNPALPAGITATFSSSASAGSPVGGSYPITVQFFGSGSGNYQSTFAGGSATAITIQPAAVNVVVNSTSKSYGAINPNFTGTLSGTYGADATNGNIAVTYSTAATQSSPVNGSTGYPITATGLTLSGSAAGNYTLGTVTPGTLTINPAIVSGSVNSTSKTYGAVNPTFTGSFNGILPADSANVTVNYSTTATQFSPVNGVTGYPITAISLTLTGSATGNYSLGTVTAGTLTINPITVSGAVNSTSRSYGANNPAFTSTLNGILPADSTNVIPLYSTTATQTSPVNGATGYPITMTGLSGLAAGNYTLGTVTPGTLTILPAIVNVTATSTSRGYGAANPAFTGTFSNVIAQDQANVTANFSTTATANSPVSGSPYPITASALILTGSATGNYTLGTVTAGNLTIAPAAVSVSVNSTSRAYGAANPSFTSTLGGVLVADTANVTPIYSTAATQTSPVSGSPYAITVTGLTLTGSATGNYTLGTVTTGNLTINPIAAGVSVNSATRQYGLANPTFSGTLSNVLSQDAGNVSAVYSTTATLTSPVSTYPITANSLTGPAAGNYTLGTVSNGVLTITPATTITGLTASAPSVGIDSQVTFTATVTSASTGTPSGSVIFSSGTTTLCTEALAGGQVQCSTSSLPAGSPVITATYGGSTNFAGSTSAGLTEIVATPGVTGTPSTSSITIKSGSSGTVTLNLTAVNYIGTATYSCALLPPGMTCSFNPASATFTSTNATATTVLTISTNGASGASGQFVSQQGPGRASPASIISVAGLWLPCAFAGFFGLAKWRRPMLRRMMLLVVLAAGLAGLAAVSGCGGSSGTRQTTPGTYNIQVVITAGTVQVIPLTVIVQ